MSDKYILRSGAIDAIKRNSGTLYTREAEFLLRRVILLLKNAPAADVVPVVRCKDCKHGELYARNDGETGVYCNCSNSIFQYANEHTFTPVRDKDDFCSYGEAE